MPGIGIFGLSGLATTLIAVALSGLVSAGGGFYVGHEIGEAKLKGVELQYQMTYAAAARKAIDEQKTTDQKAMAAALAEASAQQAIVVQGSNIVHEVTRYVKVPSKPLTVATGCITVGFVRVLDAAVLGRDPASLPDIAGQPDDACTSLDPVAMATGIVGNYETCRANSEQLNALISLVGKDHTSGAQK